MKSNLVEEVEFIGGPEDGRIVDRAALPLLHVACAELGVLEIPMFVRIDENLQLEEGDELELVLIGQYVCEQTQDKRLKYRWLE